MLVCEMNVIPYRSIASSIASRSIEMHIFAEVISTYKSSFEPSGNAWPKNYVRVSLCVHMSTGLRALNGESSDFKFRSLFQQFLCRIFLRRTFESHGMKQQKSRAVSSRAVSSNTILSENTLAFQHTRKQPDTEVSSAMSPSEYQIRLPFQDGVNDGLSETMSDLVETASTTTSIESPTGQDMNSGYITPEGNGTGFFLGSVNINFYSRICSNIMPLQVKRDEKMIHLKIRLLDDYYHNFMCTPQIQALNSGNLLFIDKDSNILENHNSLADAKLKNNDLVEVVIRANFYNKEMGPQDFFDHLEDVSKTLLQEAAHGKEENIVRMLHLEGRGCEAMDENGNNALHHCTRRGMTSAVYHLVSNHPESLLSKNLAGLTPLHLACQHVDPVKSAMYTRFFIESVIETGPVTKERNGDQKSGARLEPSPSELEIFLTCKSAQGESPLKLCLYSSNMTTAAVLIGLERNLGGKWNGFQIVRDELYADENLMRFVAANSPFLLNALVESCRLETEKWRHGKRLVLYQTKKLFGSAEKRARDTPISIFLAACKHTNECQSLWRLRGLQFVVETKWNLFGRQAFYKDVTRHSVLLLATTLGYTNNSVSMSSWQSTFFQQMAALLALYVLVSIESKELREAGWGINNLFFPFFLFSNDSGRKKVTPLNADSANANEAENGDNEYPGHFGEAHSRQQNVVCSCFPKYFLSLQNWVDFFGLLNIVAAGVLRWFDANNDILKELRIMLASTGALLLWIGLIQLISVTRSFGIQSAMVERMIGDVIQLTGIFFVFLMAFNCAFNILLHDTSQEFDGFFRGLFTLFLSALGDFGFMGSLYKPADSFYFMGMGKNETFNRRVVIDGIESSVRTNRSIITECIFVVFGIIMNLVLVNMLIAFMSNTYEETKSHSEAEFYRKRAARIMVIESTLGHHIRRSLFSDVEDEVQVWETCDDENLRFRQVPHISEGIALYQSDKLASSAIASLSGTPKRSRQSSFSGWKRGI